MRLLVLVSTLVVFPLVSFAQDARDQLLMAERGLTKATGELGVKPAVLQFFSDDAIIFRPEAINSKDFWNRKEDAKSAAVREVNAYGIASNGQIGYTTGSIEIFGEGVQKPPTEFGDYVTVWGRRQNGEWRAVLEMVVKHAKDIKLPFKQETTYTPFQIEANKGQRSAADPSMSFLRISMGTLALGGAYKSYAADDVRLLRDGLPPIVGKGRVIQATKDFRSVKFPGKVALIESGDMAYSWNPCEYNVSDEGLERGNCLHIWKLRGKKWWIVLGAFARVESTTVPKLKPKEPRKKV